MPAHEFRHRVHDDVRAVLDQTRSDIEVATVLSHQRNVMRMGDIRQHLDIADVAGRVSDAFAKNRAGVGVDRAGDILRPLALGEADPDPLSWKDMRQQGVRRAVQLRRGYNVPPWSATFAKA